MPSPRSPDIEWTDESRRSESIASWTDGEIQALVRGTRWTAMSWQVVINGRRIASGECSDANAFESAKRITEIGIDLALTELAGPRASAWIQTPASAERR